MSAEELRRGPVAAAIRRGRVIVVLRRVTPRAALVGLVAELAGAGARAFEITFDASSAEDDVGAVREHLAARSDGPFLVGAGTVLTADQLAAAGRAGADFVVSPVLDADLVRAAVAAGMPVVPGAMTPTEIAAAWSAGATFVKLFPAAAVGPSFVRELHGPLPTVELIPTGGLDAARAGAFLEAGAAAVGIGSAITNADAAGRRALVEALAGRRGPA